MSVELRGSRPAGRGEGGQEGRPVYSLIFSFSSAVFVGAYPCFGHRWLFPTTEHRKRFGQASFFRDPNELFSRSERPLITAVSHNGRGSGCRCGTDAFMLCAQGACGCLLLSGVYFLPTDSDSHKHTNTHAHRRLKKKTQKREIHRHTTHR